MNLSQNKADISIKPVCANMSNVLKPVDSTTNQSLFMNKICNFEVEIKLKNTNVPYVSKPRRYPHAVIGKIIDKLHELEASDIIEKVDKCEWINALVHDDLRAKLMRNLAGGIAMDRFCTDLNKNATVAQMKLMIQSLKNINAIQKNLNLEY
ncbi:hypothetical protein A3Q56_05128 [Intoshia linei]|uniref:Uncharacterized protein n=1 Tax=Intoshia linei TaxID=1819745 RepID=A0A177AZ50_9BILA|nr:hypothetical protein A3Q56_05128 [Intoshia linei]